MPRKPRNSRFATGPKATENLPVVPSDWEKLLAQIGVRQCDAVAQIEAGTVAGHRISTFARNHARNRYVPEEVLSALGILTPTEAA